MSRLPESPSTGNHNSTSAEQLTYDLFDRGAPVYPAAPGFRKGSDTSKEAAEKIAPVASALRGRVARLFKEAFPASFTADEAAKALNLSPFAVRPRITELGAAGLIERTGERRSNPTSTMRAHCWRAAGLLLDQEDR